jgi:hypothetical protein
MTGSITSVRSLAHKDEADEAHLASGPAMAWPHGG